MVKEGQNKNLFASSGRRGVVGHGFEIEGGWGVGRSVKQGQKYYDQAINRGSDPIKVPS